MPVITIYTDYWDECHSQKDVSGKKDKLDTIMEAPFEIPWDMFVVLLLCCCWVGVVLVLPELTGSGGVRGAVPGSEGAGRGHGLCSCLHRHHVLDILYKGIPSQTQEVVAGLLGRPRGWAQEVAGPVWCLGCEGVGGRGSLLRGVSQLLQSLFLSGDLHSSVTTKPPYYR